MKKLLIPLLLALLLTGCGKSRTVPPTAVETPEPTAEVTAPPLYTVRYTVNGEIVRSETLEDGGTPTGAAVEGGFRCWLDPAGNVVRPETVEIHADLELTAAFVPALNDGRGAFEPDRDGLFRPDAEFTRSDAVRLVYNLLQNKPATEVFLADVTTAAACYKAASTLAAADYFPLDEGKFYPDVPIALGDLAALLERIFPVTAVDAALSHCELPLTRGGAAMLFAELLGLQSGEADYPDVPRDHPCYAAVSALGGGSRDWGSRQGFLHLNGRLFCFDENGYFIKDTDLGSLHFGSDGAYTSGDELLDAMVAKVLRNKVEPVGDREEALKKAYLYVRDSFLYLRRNYYEVGETGWEIDEARTMMETGKGNCYNFTGTFWALARALGYDAKCVSGLVGHEADPHSWVEIPFEDGVTYIFDPETEMSYRLKDQYFNCFKMTYEEGQFWTYYRG
ncbi:MAG: transglutaminase-like domain-containing protein [Oscillospiraceae bacterium]|nr:transglutaminase-like domain-containing protein [Oscillospiraceae bacterium]